MAKKKARAKALKHQYLFLSSTARFPLLLAGLGSGKTEALIYKTLDFITKVPNASVGLYEPTVDLIKRILYKRFEEIFASSGYKYTLNKTDNILKVWMHHGIAEIVFRSMENHTRIIGYENHIAICDEIDTLDADKAMEVWIRVLARTRKKYYLPDGSRGKNTIGVTTTPEGFKFCYKMWVKEHADNPDYELIKARTLDNYHLDPEYVPTLRATYPPQLIEAYLNGEFISLKGNVVYSGFNRSESNTNLTLIDFPSSQTIHIGMDFNVGRMAAVVGMRNTSDDSNVSKMYIIDELHHLMDTPAMITAIQTRYPNRTIIVYPDASGRSRKSQDASKSDIRLLRDAGFKVNAPNKNPPVRERTVSVNAAFLNSDNQRALFVNVDKCPNLTEVLEKQVYDDNSIPVKDGSEDPADALGYLINRTLGLARPTTMVAKMKFGG